MLEDVDSLSPVQRAVINDVTRLLAGLDGVDAVVLGGSHARGRATAASDIDLGVFYSDAGQFSVADLRRRMIDLNDTPDAVVSGFYEWGRWVNGGAWLTIRGCRTDLLYRSLDRVGQVIADADAGRWELDYAQQPPFGFFSATYLGEVAVCRPIIDPLGHLTRLKQRVATYPEGLRRAVVQDCLWAAEFNLHAFARKFAARGDLYGTMSCATRAVNHLVLALFALNRTYLLNDKTALAEIAAFPATPTDFGARIAHVLAAANATPIGLTGICDEVEQLFAETARASAGLYQPRYVLH